MNDLYTTVLKRLVEYRTEINMTQDAFSDILETSQENYSRIENGYVLMSWEILSKLADFSGDIDYFFTGTKTGETELNNLFRKCRVERRYELVKLFCWLIGWEFGDVFRKDTMEYRILTYLRVMEENHFDEKEKWVAVRKAYNLSQEKIAKILGIRVETYRDIEKDKGKHKKDSEMLFVLYEEIGVLPSLLLGNEESILVEINRFWKRIDSQKKETMLECVGYFDKMLGLCEKI